MLILFYHLTWLSHSRHTESLQVQWMLPKLSMYLHVFFPCAYNELPWSTCLANRNQSLETWVTCCPLWHVRKIKHFLTKTSPHVFPLQDRQPLGRRPSYHSAWPSPTPCTVPTTYRKWTYQRQQLEFQGKDHYSSKENTPVRGKKLLWAGTHALR